MTPVYILASLILLIAIYIIIPWMLKLYIKHRTNKFLRKKNVSCLTFDDGPHPNYTPKILDSLDNVGIKATFFVLGKQAEAYPDLIQDMLARGHEIASHSYGHTHAWHTDPITTFVDLTKGEKVIKRFRTGRQVKIMRPPFGKVNLVSFIYCLLTNTKLIFWNLDSLDYKYESAAELHDNLKSRIKTGQIILLHDGRYGDDTESKSAMTTVNAVSSLLKSTEIDRSRFLTVSQALYSDS